MKLLSRTLVVITVLGSVVACSAVASSGEAVESIGNGGGRAISGVGEAIGDAGQAIGQGAGEIVSGTGEAIKRGATRTENKGY